MTNVQHFRALIYWNFETLILQKTPKIYPSMTITFLIKLWDMATMWSAQYLEHIVSTVVSTDVNMSTNIHSCFMLEKTNKLISQPISFSLFYIHENKAWIRSLLSAHLFFLLGLIDPCL